MAGTPRGCVDIWFNHTLYTASRMSQMIFKKIYDIVVSHPNMEIVSLFYGGTGTVGDGLGTNYWYEANSFRGGAFFVVKMPANAGRDFDYYWLCQFSGTAALAGAALPVQLNGGAMGAGTLGFAVCAVSGSSENPWNGGLLADGTDAKGSPVWNVGVGTVLPLPASNALGGTDVVNKENLGGLTSWVAADGSHNGTRLNILCDDDHFCILQARGDSSYLGLVFFGPYKDAFSGRGSNQLLMYSEPAGSSNSVNFNGSPTPDREGAIQCVGDNGSNVVVAPVYRQFSDRLVYNNDPSEVLEANVEYGLNLFSQTTGSFGYFGLYGGSDFLSTVAFVHNNSVNLDSTRAYFGPVVFGAIKIGIPWDGVTVPTSRFDHSGSFF
jgi:hypothetical protein